MEVLDDSSVVTTGSLVVTSGGICVVDFSLNVDVVSVELVVAPPVDTLVEPSVEVRDVSSVVTTGSLVVTSGGV